MREVEIKYTLLISLGVVLGCLLFVFFAGIELFGAGGMLTLFISFLGWQVIYDNRNKKETKKRKLEEIEDVWSINLN